MISVLTIWEIMENAGFQQDDALISPCLCVNSSAKYFQAFGFFAVLQHPHPH
jgi:hypothetical protein